MAAQQKRTASQHDFGGRSGAASAVGPGSPYEKDRARLERLLKSTEKLLCVAPAMHKSADGQRSRNVYLGVGKVEKNDDHFVFIFARTVLPCFTSWREFIYCVIPVVKNIAIDISPEKCVFTWRQDERQTYRVGVHRSRLGDCFIDGVTDISGTVTKTLKEVYETACKANVMYGESCTHHQEMSNYLDSVPMDLKDQPPAQNPLRSIDEDEVPKAGTSLWLFFITWNVGATMPNDDLTLGHILRPDTHKPIVEDLPDIICVGLQEICELTAKRLIQDGDEWAQWSNWVEQDITELYEGRFVFLEKSHLVGMLTLVYVRRTLMPRVTDVRISTLATGFGGVTGNKGGTGIRFDLDDQSFCLINCHLAANQEHYLDRCKHFGQIMEEMRFLEPKDEPQETNFPTPGHGEYPQSGLLKTLEDGGKPPKPAARSYDKLDAGSTGEPGDTRAYTIKHHDHIFWIGDTNSRLHWNEPGGMPIEMAVEKVQDRRIGELLALDQLHMMRNHRFAFQGFEEPRIFFLPSYKWRPHHDELDMRQQRHVPAWCDRILYKGKHPRSTAKNVSYNIHLGLQQSDHRPVHASWLIPWEHELPTEIDKESEGTFTVQEDALDISPSAIEFPRKVQPDTPQEVSFTMKQKTKKETSIRFIIKVCRKGEMLENAGPVPSARMVREKSTNPLAVMDADLVRCLSCSPVEGVIRPDAKKPVEVRIALNVNMLVAYKQSLECELVIQLSWNKITSEQRIGVQVQLQPSVMRLPLEHLYSLKDRAVQDQSDETNYMAQTKVTPDHPMPKEILAVMTWIYEQSMRAPPRTLEWWPTPAEDDMPKNQLLVSRLQKLVEGKKPLQQNDPDLPVKAGTYFLLRWLASLPNPIVSETALDQFLEMEGMDTLEAIRVALRSMEEISRNILIYTATLLAMLKINQNTHDFSVPLLRFAGALTSHTRAADGNKILVQLMKELSKSKVFPPPQSATDKLLH